MVIQGCDNYVFSAAPRERPCITYGRKISHHYDYYYSLPFTVRKKTVNAESDHQVNSQAREVVSVREEKLE
jgi:hypothetical protein